MPGLMPSSGWRTIAPRSHPADPRGRRGRPLGTAAGRSDHPGARGGVRAGGPQHRRAHLVGRDRCGDDRCQPQLRRPLLGDRQPVPGLRGRSGNSDVRRRRSAVQPARRIPQAGRRDGRSFARRRLPDPGHRLRRHEADVASLGQPARLGRRIAPAHRQSPAAATADRWHDRGPGRSQHYPGLSA